MQVLILFLLSSVLYYLDDLFDTNLKNYLLNFLFNIGLAILIICIVFIINARNSNDINNKISLMCQSWLSKSDGGIMNRLKKIIFAQNTFLSNDKLQCYFGIAISLHVITACFKSFVPVMSNGWGGKKIYLLLALVLTTLLSMMFMGISFNCSFNNNNNIKNLTSGEKWNILFTNLNSNVLYNIIVPMLACCVIGFFTYSQLQSNILSSKFQITDNDYKQNQTILKLTNKTDLMSTWKYYNVKNYQNGELLNDISGGNAFNNVYTQTTNGENDANFKSSLQSVIDQYDLPVSSDTLYMILKVNNKIIDGNTNQVMDPYFYIY